MNNNNFPDGYKEEEDLDSAEGDYDGWLEEINQDIADLLDEEEDDTDD